MSPGRPHTNPHHISFSNHILYLFMPVREGLESQRKELFEVLQALLPMGVVYVPGRYQVIKQIEVSLILCLYKPADSSLVPFQ